MPSLAHHSVQSDNLTERLSGQLFVEKRDGSIISFDPARIARAIAKAFHADLQLPADAPLDDFSMREVEEITREAEEKLLRCRCRGPVIHIEDIQDLVEILLMQHAHYTVAKTYILYRSRRADVRSIDSKVKALRA